MFCQFIYFSSQLLPPMLPTPLPTKHDNLRSLPTKPTPRRSVCLTMLSLLGQPPCSQPMPPQVLTHRTQHVDSWSAEPTIPSTTLPLTKNPSTSTLSLTIENLIPTGLLMHSSRSKTVPSPSPLVKIWRMQVMSLSTRVNFVLCRSTILLSQLEIVMSCLRRWTQTCLGWNSFSKPLKNVSTPGGLAKILPRRKNSWTQPQSSMAYNLFVATSLNNFVRNRSIVLIIVRKKNQQQIQCLKCNWLVFLTILYAQEQQNLDKISKENQDKTMKKLADKRHKSKKLKKKIHILLAPPKNLTKKYQKCPFLTDLYFWQFWMLKNNKIWTRFQWKIKRKRWKFLPTSGIEVQKLGKKFTFCWRRLKIWPKNAKNALS